MNARSTAHPDYPYPLYLSVISFQTRLQAAYQGSWFHSASCYCVLTIQLSIADMAFLGLFNYKSDRSRPGWQYDFDSWPTTDRSG